MCAGDSSENSAGPPVVRGGIKEQMGVGSLSCRTATIQLGRRENCDWEEWGRYAVWEAEWNQRVRGAVWLPRWKMW